MTRSLIAKHASPIQAMRGVERQVAHLNPVLGREGQVPEAAFQASINTAVYRQLAVSLCSPRSHLAMSRTRTPSMEYSSCLVLAMSTLG